MELRLDLHIHSHHSPDGFMTAEAIASRARETGLNGFAICDHDRVFPAEELQTVSDAYPDLLIIPGVEVSTDCGHLLGWFVTEPIAARTLPEAVAEIHRQGGVAVLAHPFEHTNSPKRAERAAPYVDGIEVWNSRAERKNRRANAMARAFAEAHSLPGFGGSDAHTPQEVGNGVTALQVSEHTPDAVRKALLSGSAEASGTRSKAIWTAVSQYQRRKKSKASPFSYCKWAAFAVKCLLDDVFRP